MTTPNWPQFPGVPNMSLDEKGRPSVMDLVPGKQEGTPISQDLINPIIHSLCDLSDHVSATVTGSDKVISGLGYYTTDKDIKRFWLGSANADVPIIADKDDHQTNLARADTLNNEIARAQGAEARLLQSVPASDHDDRLNDLVWNHTDGHLAAQLPSGSWESFYPTEKTVQALVYSDADARPTTIRTLKKGWGGSPSLIVENDGFDAISAPSSSAVDEIITNETVRAQNAEAGLTAWSEFPCNLAQAGWQRLPNGLILQWLAVGGRAGNYNFPIAFPNEAFLVFATNTDAQGSVVDNAFAYIVDNTQFYYASKASNSAEIQAYPAALLALGR